MEVHAHKTDPSFRCFHVDLDQLKPEELTSLAASVVAITGTGYVGYRACVGDQESDGILIDMSEVLAARNFKFFFPCTTTLIELILNREPLPPAPQPTPICTLT